MPTNSESEIVFCSDCPSRGCYIGPVDDAEAKLSVSISGENRPFARFNVYLADKLDGITKIDGGNSTYFLTSDYSFREGTVGFNDRVYRLKLDISKALPEIGSTLKQRIELCDNPVQRECPAIGYLATRCVVNQAINRLQKH